MNRSMGEGKSIFDGHAGTQKRRKTEPKFLSRIKCAETVINIDLGGGKANYRHERARDYCNLRSICHSAVGGKRTPDGCVQVFQQLSLSWRRVNARGLEIV